MSLLDRLKRKGKLKGVGEAHPSPGGVSTSTTALPIPPIVSHDTEILATPDIGDTGTPTPVPSVLSHTQIHSLCTNTIATPESKTENKIQSTSSHTPLSDPNEQPDSQIKGNDAPAQFPGSTLGPNKCSPSTNPTPDTLTNSQSIPSQLVEQPQNTQTSPPITNPAHDTIDGDVSLPALPSQPDPQGTLYAVDAVSGPRAATQKLHPASGPATRPSKTTLTPTWEGLNKFRRALRGVTGVSGPLGPVIEGLSDCFDIYEDAMKARKGYETLKTELESLFSLLSEHFSGTAPLTMTAAMNNLCVAIEAELDHISTKEARGRGRRCLEAAKDPDDIMERYNSIKGHLERLKLNADLSMWKIVDDLAVETRLKSLLSGPVLAACYDSAEARELSRRECTPETRKSVLADLSDWRHDKTQGNIYWLNGMAGTGKTTIASSLCAMLDKSQELGASFFCSRLLPYCRDIKLILPAIAYQLARYSRPLRCSLFLALQEEPDLPSKSLPKQIEGLIVKPLRKVADALPTDIVVVVDALDECDDSQGVGFLLELFLKHASDLPIRFFISSRPEPRIRQMIGDTKSQLILHELEKSIVKEDIRLYLQTELDGLLSFISDADLAALVDQAGVLFIYAATVVRFVTSSPAIPLQRKRFRDLIGMSGSGRLHQEQAVDALYDTVLASAFDNLDLQYSEKGAMKLVLDTVICAQEPLTVTAVARLLEIGDESLVQAALDPFWSVLHVSGGDGLVTTLHTSFPEYMLHPIRSKERVCRARTHHTRLAKLCFDRIKNNKPQFNICGLKSSFVLDDQVPNLEERVMQAVPHELMYACQYWASHLELGEPSVDILQQLTEFASKRLFLWLEILNLQKRSMISASALSKAETWCRAYNTPQETKDMIHDAWRFATVFATSSASRSTPHLYVSMIVSWKSSGRLQEEYKNRMKGPVCVEGTGFAKQESALLSTFLVGSKVMSVAFSPNSMYIASGSDDNAVRLWDVRSGEVVGGPIAGHISSVTAVAFSPDGTRIVSGSDDKTIRVWDARSGKPVVDPITGHTSSVTSVACSPDFMRIVSGSRDQTIRIWDATSGISLTGPIMGHTSQVNSVAFSPNSMRIVSGSEDSTVRVWNAISGNLVAGPFKEHASAVNSVAFAPDGIRIVSGSEDQTICVWDITSGKLLIDMLSTVPSSFTSVAFSPDGMRIVSGTLSGSICVWNAMTGIPLVEENHGHTSGVTSVVFSPDSMRIASGALDSTICVWDSTSRKSVAGPLDPSNDWSLYLRFVAYRVWTSGWQVRDRLMCLRSSILSRCIPQPATDLSVPTALGPLRHNSMRSRDESGWRLIKEIIQTTLNSQIIAGWFIPVNTLRAHFLTILVLCMLALFDNTFPGRGIGAVVILRHIFAFSPQGKVLVQRAKETRGVAGLTDKFLELDFNWYYLVCSLRVLEEFCDSVPIERPYQLLSKILMWGFPRLNDWVIWVQGAIYAYESVQVLGNHLRILSDSAYYLIVNILAIMGIYFTEACLFVLWMEAYSIRSAAFSPDGTRIVSGSDDKTVRVWDVTRGVPLTNPIVGHTASITSVAFSSNGTLIASGSEDNTVRVWNARSGEPIAGPIRGHTSAVNSVAFSLDETCIVSGSTDGTIRIWGATSGNPVNGPQYVSESSVASVAFSPDGTRIVSSHLDNTIRVWDVTSGRETMHFCCQCAGSAHSVAFTSDGMRILSACNRWMIRIWDTCTPKDLHNLWTLNEDGWVVDNQGNLLLWLPAESRRYLLPSQNLYLISARGFIALNFDRANIGDSWTKCYVCA